MPVMSSPSKVIVPLVTGRTPEIVLRVVVLPAPFAPMRVTISPSSTCERHAPEGLDLAVVDVDVARAQAASDGTPR